MIHATQASKGAHFDPAQPHSHSAQAGGYETFPTFEAGGDAISRGHGDQAGFLGTLLPAPQFLDVPAGNTGLHPSLAESAASRIHTANVSLSRTSPRLHDPVVFTVPKEATQVVRTHTAEFDARTYDEWKNSIDPAHWGRFLQSWDKAIADAFSESHQLGCEALARRSRFTTMVPSRPRMDSSTSSDEPQGPKRPVSALGADVPSRAVRTRTDQAELPSQLNLDTKVYSILRQGRNCIASDLSREFLRVHKIEISAHDVESALHRLGLSDEASKNAYRRRGKLPFTEVHKEWIRHLIRLNPDLACRDLAKMSSTAYKHTHMFLMSQGLNTISQRRVYAQRNQAMGRDRFRSIALNRLAPSASVGVPADVSTGVTSPRTSALQDLAFAEEASDSFLEPHVIGDVDEMMRNIA